MSPTLDVLAVGGRARIASVDGAGPVPLRLLEMGLLPEAEVFVVRRAPLGDPIEIEVMGYRLVLRASEARHVALR